MMRYRVPNHAPLEEACAAAVDVARRHQKSARLRFNGVDLVATPQGEPAPMARLRAPLRAGRSLVRSVCRNGRP